MLSNYYYSGVFELNNESENGYVLAGPGFIGSNSPTILSSAPIPLSPQGSARGF